MDKSIKISNKDGSICIKSSNFEDLGYIQNLKIDVGVKNQRNIKCEIESLISDLELEILQKETEFVVKPLLKQSDESIFLELVYLAFEKNNLDLLPIIKKFLENWIRYRQDYADLLFNHLKVKYRNSTNMLFINDFFAKLDVKLKPSTILDSNVSRQYLDQEFGKKIAQEMKQGGLIHAFVKGIDK